MFPGSDLLSDALEVIDPTEIGHRKFEGRILNDYGLYVSTFEAEVTLEASVQAVPRSAYKQFGLDFQRNYLSAFVSADVLDLQRDVAGDRFIIKGKLFQVVSEVPWFEIDGWVNVTVVQITELEPSP